MTRNAATARYSSAPSLNARPCLGGILSSEIKKLRNEPTSSSFRNLPFSAKGYAIRMSLSLSWTDIALRLLLTVIVGGIIGANRGDPGEGSHGCTDGGNCNGVGEMGKSGKRRKFGVFSDSCGL